MNYFELIPVVEEFKGKSYHTYVGSVKFPEKVKKIWYNLPENIENEILLKEWISFNKIDSPCVGILFSIWSGVDIKIFNFLIEQSFSYPNLVFLYKHSQYYKFLDFFSKDDKSKIRSPLLFFDKNIECISFKSGITSEKEIIAILESLNDMRIKS